MQRRLTWRRLARQMEEIFERSQAGHSRLRFRLQPLQEDGWGWRRPGTMADEMWVRAMMPRLFHLSTVHSSCTVVVVLQSYQGKVECVCCHPIYSGRQVCGRTSRGHTGGRSHRISHPPSFCGACLKFLSREGFSRSLPSSTLKSNFVSLRINRSLLVGHFSQFV